METAVVHITDLHLDNLSFSTTATRIKLQDQCGNLISMAQQSALGNAQVAPKRRSLKSTSATHRTRPTMSQSQSDPTPTTVGSAAAKDAIEDDGFSGEARDVVDIATMPNLPRSQHIHLPDRHQSCSTADDSPTDSPTRSSPPKPSVPSSATSASIYMIDSFTGFNNASARRPSILNRLKSSISTASTATHVSHRPFVNPADFQIRPEQPEQRFVDALGMILPGVCDRNQCAHPYAHFVSQFRLCEPIEYTTALADHGITYTDYCRLVTALLNFLEETTLESKRRRSDPAINATDSDDEDVVLASRNDIETSTPEKNTMFDTTEQLRKTREKAIALNKLLVQITWNLQARGLPVMICVHSFSLFAPYHIAEAHVQVLHVTLDQIFHMALKSEAPIESSKSDPQNEEGISFIDPSSLAEPDDKWAHSQFERRSVSGTIPRTRGEKYAKQHQLQLQHHLQHRDRSKPMPLWPNTIPSRKRQVMNANAARYGADPYFRAWMRTNINSRVQSNTYEQYLIEQDADPSINKKLKYVESASRGVLLLNILQNGTHAWTQRSASNMNRAKYEHNRKLECRKALEQGSRLRIVRFGFSQSIYPPHTPEMDRLGLTKEEYDSILFKIDAIHTPTHVGSRWPLYLLQASLNKIRQQSTKDALVRVSEFIRKLNASQKRIVWTIEKVPSVYDRRFARGRTEWEISAWNGEDPLELLIQLENWGIIETKLGVEDGL